ncbi:MAG: GH25 family lysozyme [Gaiellaceae bacterium]
MGSRVGRCLVALAAAAALCAAPASGSGVASYAKGVDVSHYNGAVDWTHVVTASYKFVFAKATEGFTLIDPTYPINRQGTESLGIRFGAYHFGRPSGSGDAGIAASAIAQADFLVGTAQPQAGELPPVLDLETKGTLSQTSLVKWTQAWLDEVQARTGVQPFIYASPSFWKTALGDTTAFAGNGNRLWIAHWTKNASPLVPAANWDGLGWTFWQWTDCSTVPGFVHCSDADRFNGTDPSPVAIAPYPTGAPVASVPPTIVGAPQAGRQLAAVPGSWSGGKPVAFAYQWQRCDAAGRTCTSIPGATAETYKPGSDDVGHALELQLTASTNDGTASATSAATVAVAAAGAPSASQPQAITSPSAAGTAQVGQVLTASVGTWSGSPTAFSYAWRRCDPTGASCGVIAGATAATYTITPGDVGATISLAVTATGPGGSQAVATPPTATVALAPIPAAVPTSLAATAGSAGAVVTTDARATVTWQPGAVPVGATVSLVPSDGGLAVAGTGLLFGVTGAVSLPWPVDVAYAAAPAGTLVGTTTNGIVWTAATPLTAATLPAGVTTGSYVDGTGALHVLTRTPQQIALFQAGLFGDPSLVVAGPPTITRAGVLRAKRSGWVITITTTLNEVSQARLYAGVAGTSILGAGSRLATPLTPGAVRTAQATLLRPGKFTVVLRVGGRQLRRGATGHLRVAAIDPWGRRGVLLLAFRAP